MTGYKGKSVPDDGSYYAPYVPLEITNPPKETWETYLRRLGNGLNGIAIAGVKTKTTVTEADIVARAKKYMQIKYPGNYIVEPFYNAKKSKFDLRLKFETPQEELMWKLKWS